MYMNKVKIALTLLSVAIVIAPLLGVTYIYRDNLLGLVLPPQIKSMISGGGDSNSNSDGSQLSQTLSQFQMPQPVGQPQYNPDTGAFSYPFNVTNPLSTPISLTQLSAEIVSTQGNVPLGNVSINQPINIDPGANSIVNLTGTLNQDTVNQLTSQLSNGTNLSSLNIGLQNVNVDIDGITVHMNQINAGEIPSLG